MTNREIYQTALTLLGEAEADCADYEARAPMLLASFARSHAAIDREYRRANGLSEPSSTPIGATLDLDESFCLADRFCSVAAYDLAAKLIGRENESFSSMCATAADLELTNIVQREIPAMIHKIRGTKRVSIE